MRIRRESVAWTGAAPATPIHLAAWLRYRLPAALDWLQGGVALAALIAGLRGDTKTGALVLAVLALPLLRILLSPPYRHRLTDRVSVLWQTLDNYHQQRQAVPWAAIFSLAVLPSALLFLGTNRTPVGADWWPVMLNASSLTGSGSWELSGYSDYLRQPDYELPWFLKKTATGIHSAYPSGMVLFAVPVAAAARLLGTDPANYDRHHQLDRWTAAWLSAACVGLFFLVALHIVQPAPAWITSLLLATGSVMFSTVGQSLWQHGGVIFWSLIVLLLEFRQAQGSLRGAALVQGIALGMMLACRLSSGLFIVTFGLWVLARAPRRLIMIGLGAILGYLPWAAIYFMDYGKIFGPSTEQLGATGWNFTNLLSWTGVLVSPARGLLVYQPWLLLLGGTLLARNPAKGVVSGWKLFCVIYMIAHLELISSWECWWGGRCWGSRLASEIVPFGALLCLEPVARLWATTRGRCLLGALLVASFLVHFPGVYLRADLWNDSLPSHWEKLWSWSYAPFLYCFRH
jgi:hypothetical protein